VLARLRELDPARWDTGLSDAGARAAWEDAIEAVEVVDLTAPRSGTPPRRVAIIGSANVFTAPLPWMLHLAGRGVAVRVKPARGQEDAVRAMAEAIGGIEVRTWRGGDVMPEAEALDGVDGVIAFGGETAIREIGDRVPAGAPYLGFGPRFGVAAVTRADASNADALARDHAMHDGRGCMSPAAVFTRNADIDALAGAMARAEVWGPRGRLDPSEGAAIRARLMLARALPDAQVRTGDGWAVLALPASRFTPVALPRVMVVHTGTETAMTAALAPHAARLGTVASDAVPATPPAPRTCHPGWMQRPPADGVHEGVDVLAALWRA
jgi:hypothetical protein